MEGEVINSFLPDLVTAVSDSVLTVSDQCLAKGLIPGNVHDQVLESGGINKDKARTLILAVKKSTETDSRCLEILLNILEQELPYAIRENLLSKIRKELTEKANTCRAVVPLSKAVQQVPLGELSKETTLQQSALLGRLEDSIGQREHACAEKRLLEERLKVKTEKCEILKGELETLKGQNEELASNTQSRITACTNQIENLEKRIGELQKTIEEQGMQTRRSRNILVTNMEMVGKTFMQYAQQSQQEIHRKAQQEIQNREEQLKTALKDNEAFKLSLTKAEDELKMKEREYKVIVQEKELRIRELETGNKGRQSKASTSKKARETSTAATDKSPSTSILLQSKDKPPDLLEQHHLIYLCNSMKSSAQERNDTTQRPEARVFQISQCFKNFALQLGFTIKEGDGLDAYYSSVDIGYIIKGIMSKWLAWHPGDTRGSTNYPTYSHLKQALTNAELGHVADNLISYEELSKYKVQH